MASNLKFKTESERMAFARKLAERRLDQALAKGKVTKETVEKWGRENILSDMEAEILMGLPNSEDMPREIPEILSGPCDTSEN